MTGLGFGGGPWTGYTPATRASAAPGAPHTPEPIAEAGPKPPIVPTGIQGPQIPAWLAAANRMRETLAAADHRSDQQRTEAWTGDRRALALLAEASERLSPWDAAVEVFGGERNGMAPMRTGRDGTNGNEEEQ